MSVRIVLPLWLQRGVGKKRLLALIDSSRDKLHHPTPAVNLPPNAPTNECRDGGDEETLKLTFTF